MQRDAIFVDLWTRLGIINNLREHALGSLADLDGRLSRAGAVDCEVSNAEGKNRAEAFGEIFFAAIEAVDRDDQRDCAFGIFRQTQVSNDLFAFEGNSYNFERGIEKLRMRQECFEGLFIRALLARRRGNGPSSKRINAPGANVVGIGLARISLFQRLRLIEGAIAHAHESCRPLVFVGGMDALEGLLDVGGIKPDQRILANFGTMNGLGLDLIDGAFAAFLR